MGIPSRYILYTCSSSAFPNFLGLPPLARVPICFTSFPDLGIMYHYRFCMSILILKRVFTFQKAKCPRLGS